MIPPTNHGNLPHGHVQTGHIQTGPIIYAPTAPGYVVTKYNLPKSGIKDAKKLFKKYDKDHSKTVGVQELYPLMTEAFAINHLPPPNPQDIGALITKYDVNRDGQLNKTEFKCMLNELGGHKSYDKDAVLKKRDKHATKVKKVKH